MGGSGESGNRVQDGPRGDGATLARSNGPLEFVSALQEKGHRPKGCDEIKFAF